MKKFMRMVMVLLCAGMFTVSSALANDTAEVTVTLVAFEVINVPAAVALTLDVDIDSLAAGNYIQDQVVQPDGFQFAHNSATNQDVTATAVADGGNGVNDITLSVAIGAQPAQDVVDGGVVQQDVLLWSNLAAGNYEENLTWTVNATLAGTQGDANDTYIWDVTFTSADI